MRIVMMTNTYLPHVGGVARSVDRFTQGYRAAGHDVLVVAPEFEEQDEDEEGVVRVPAVQNFNGSDFALVVPLPMYLTNELNDFEPDIIHSHHPFLLGTTALRSATARRLPLVFTHHTMYEQYAHYVPVDAPHMTEFVVRMCLDYCNRCDAVIAPSESIRDILIDRGVSAPIRVIPTGVDTKEYHGGDGAAFRKKRGIPDDVLLLGHVGRLAPEKNLAFLARCVSAFLKEREDAHFMCVGSGPSRQEMEAVFSGEGVDGRIHWTGKLSGEELVSAYHALDLFVFTSKSETQGMVLVEALAASAPLVALDAPGVREVLRDGENGRLIKDESVDAFLEAFRWYADKSPDEQARLKEAAQASADPFSTEVCVNKALAFYEEVLDDFKHSPQYEESEWMAILRAIEEEWDMWTERFSAAADTFFESSGEDPKK
jgi:1,2-diacylglycerol 3-alpha-glucosyltransferase